MWTPAIARIALIASAIVMLGSPAQAQSSSPVPASVPAAQGLEAPIGKVISVTGSATVEHTAAVVVQASVASGVAPLKTGDSVYTGDVVQTGADSKLALAFADGTAFNLSSNGRMTLDEFIYDPNSKSNSTLFKLVKGNFTIVAGKVAKTGNMVFDTPVATMGIRGTTPNVQIAEDGTVKFSTLIEGKKDTAASPNQRNLRVAPTRQRKASVSPTMTPEQTATYNRLFNIDGRLCRGC